MAESMQRIYLFNKHQINNSKYDKWEGWEKAAAFYSFTQYELSYYRKHVHNWNYIRIILNATSNKMWLKFKLVQIELSKHEEYIYKT